MEEKSLFLPVTRMHSFTEVTRCTQDGTQYADSPIISRAISFPSPSLMEQQQLGYSASADASLDHTTLPRTGHWSTTSVAPYRIRTCLFFGNASHLTTGRGQVDEVEFSSQRRVQGFTKQS